MLPAIMMLESKIHLHKRTPLGTFGFANQVHARFIGCAICFECIARNTGAYDVLPSCWAAPISRHDVVEIQVFPLESSTTILASIAVPLENIMASELDLFFGQPVK